MDHLLAVAFDSHDAARSALNALRTTEADFSEACIATRDLEGLIDVTVAEGAKAMDGELWRGLVHSLTGEAAQIGVPEAFAEQVSQSLLPGRAALFALTNGVDPSVLLAKLDNAATPARCALGTGGKEELRRRIESINADPYSDNPMGWQAGFGSFQ